MSAPNAPVCPGILISTVVSPSPDSRFLSAVHKHSWRVLRHHFSSTIRPWVSPSGRKLQIALNPQCMAGQHSVQPHHEVLANYLNPGRSLVYEWPMTRAGWRGLAVSLIRRDTPNSKLAFSTVKMVSVEKRPCGYPAQQNDQCKRKGATQWETEVGKRIRTGLRNRR